MKKNNKGFTLIELLAVIVILGVIILIAVNAVLPQVKKAKRNSFAIEVGTYAKAAEKKYVADSVTYSLNGADINSGICYDIVDDLNKTYVEKNDPNYSGIVIIKSESPTSNKHIKYVFISSNKFYYNTKKSGSTYESFSKIDGKDVLEGGESNLTFKNCEEWYDAN